MEISLPPGEKRIVFKEMKKREIGERRKFGFGSENIYIYISLDWKMDWKMMMMMMIVIKLGDSCPIVYFAK